MNDRLDFIQKARELTGSSDMATLIAAAKQLEEYIDSPVMAPLGVPTHFFDFLKYVKIVHPIKGFIDFAPYPFQREFSQKLGRYLMQDRPKPLIHCTARQMGSSTMITALALWYALSSRRQKILFLGPRMASADDIRDQMKLMLENLPYTFGRSTANSSRYGTTFSNGSHITFSTNSSPSIMLITENEEGEQFYEFDQDYDLIVMMDTSYVSYSYDAMMEQCIQTATDRGTPIIMTSAPNLAKGLFYKMWSQADEDSKILHRWSDHTERDLDFKKMVEKNLGVEAFAREYECQFLPPV